MTDRVSLTWAGIVVCLAAAGCKTGNDLIIPEEGEATGSSSYSSDGTAPQTEFSSEAALSQPVYLPRGKAAPAPSLRVHIVKKGDTLMQLARNYYGDASRWRSILEANRDRLPDPNRLYVGQELVIPN